MRPATLNDSAITYRLGKRALASHDTMKALRLLREAVDTCPASRSAELARRLYWLSISLRRLGKNGLAIKALASAQKLAPRGRVRDMYERFANDYGMPRAACREHDDYRAFCSIHVRRYLDTVADHRFASEEEVDLVLKTIAGAWIRVKAINGFSSTGCLQKLKAFRDTVIEFPVLQSQQVVPVCKTIPVDFRHGRAIGSDDRCTCGSGLPFRLCCGRTRFPYEAERG